MKIILLKDVKGQGKKDDIIDVSDGYANNFLLKNKLGVRYSETSKKILDSQIKDKKGYKIDKKCIFINNPIDSLGTHKVNIKLHKKVEFNINVNLIK